MRQAIVQVVQELAPPGGIQILVLELRRMLQSDFDVHVVSLEGTRSRLCASWPAVRSLGASLHALDKPPAAHFGTVLRLMRLLRELSPIAVHTHHIGPLLYGGLAARLAGVPRLVHTEHDAWHLNGTRRRRLQRFAVALLRPRLVADGYLVADALTRALPTSRPIVIPNGIDMAKFSPGDPCLARKHLGLPSSGKLVGAAGRLEPVKGHDLLIDALPNLSEGVALAIAGDGSCRDALAARAADLGVGDRVRWVGHVEDMACFYQALDLFCLPSRAEGVPLVLVEAQACGIPAVATEVGGVREVLAPSTSRLVPAGDSRRLAQVINDMLTQPTPADPRQFVLQRFDLRDMAASYRTVLTA